MFAAYWHSVALLSEGFAAAGSMVIGAAAYPFQKICNKVVEVRDCHRGVEMMTVTGVSPLLSRLG